MALGGLYCIDEQVLCAGKEMPNKEHVQRNMLRLSADHVLAKVNFIFYHTLSCFAFFFFFLDVTIYFGTSV
jgi:hypothetical protein